jgi:hypothetical protein
VAAMKVEGKRNAEKLYRRKLRCEPSFKSIRAFII